MRTRYALCKYCGDLHAYGRWPDNCKSDPWPRSDHPAPYIVSDNLPGGIHGMRSMADGKMYDSKSAYYRDLKSRGYEIVANDSAYTPEGLDKFAERERGPTDDEVRQSVKDAHDFLTQDSLSNDEMHNMMREISPQEPVIPE